MKDGIERSIERFVAYESENIEKVIAHIRSGQLKAGQYASMVKIKKGDKKNDGRRA